MGFFPAAGNRNNGSGGLNNVGSNGNYWLSAANSQTNARNLNFNSGNVNPQNNNNRANGFSVCPVAVVPENLNGPRETFLRSSASLTSSVIRFNPVPVL